MDDAKGHPVTVCWQLFNIEACNGGNRYPTSATQEPHNRKKRRVLVPKESTGRMLWILTGGSLVVEIA
jgi:hypothetical protein